MRWLALLIKPQILRGLAQPLPLKQSLILRSLPAINIIFLSRYKVLLNSLGELPMKSLDSLDQKIRETLAEHDSKLQKEIEVIDRGEGYFDLLMASIHGRQAWITYYIYGLSAVTLAVFIYSLTGYLASTSVDSSLDWALGLIACMFIFTVVKVIAFEQMLKFEMLREMKRIELRVMLKNRNNEG